ncbi:MAG: NAD(P)H-dependent oxidoreductase [Candidatus Omnitrophica bacterium]|nr:NAD(P)H-dependent oxidoreductase [Candidatus Omnitrophota bacterium]
MDYLLIYAHPNPKSFNHAILETLTSRFDKEKRPFQVRDLYKLNFKPSLSSEDFISFSSNTAAADIKQEQNLIEQGKTLIFIYPIWWFGMPAILKGYIDRVLSRNFAYGVNEKGPYGLLSNKKVVIINTTGGPKEHYEEGGLKDILKTTIDVGVFGFCGIKITLHKYFYAVPYIGNESRQNMLKELKAIQID